MPRRITPFLSGYYYHIYNRGNNRQKIFFERDNYLYFLRGVREYLSPHSDILVYCLMPTHYHLLVRLKITAPLDPSISSLHNNPESSAFSHAMQKLSISYTKAINKRFERVGTLFQGQFHGKQVSSNDHLAQLCIYIHANPAKDNLVSSPEEWEYSNYLECLKLRNGILADHQFIEEIFGTPQHYKELVTDYLKHRKMNQDLQNYLTSLED